MKRLGISLALVFTTILCGCSFSRSVVNPHHDRLDTSWIIPGKTTKPEIIRRFGMPPGIINGRGGIKGDTMRWVTADSFTGTLEAGYFVTPTFEISREHSQHDLLVKFDADNVVTLVSHVRSCNGKTRVLDFREAQ